MAVSKAFAARFLGDEFGATAVEYGLIAAIICVGIIFSVGQIKDSLNTIFGNVSPKFTQ